MTRCTCGYAREWHPAPGHCPLCACGRLPGEHLPTAVTPSPLLEWDGKQLAVCPGKPRTAAGHLPTLRRGSYVAAPPAESFRPLPELPQQREVPPDAITLRRAVDAGLPAAATHPDPPYACFPLASGVPQAPAGTLSEPQAPPQVPARYTASLDEIAPRAMPVGKQAAALGWSVDPWYYRAADGTETSVLVMCRGELRAAASWERPPGGSWKTAGALALPPGSWPLKVGVKRLVEIIVELG